MSTTPITLGGAARQRSAIVMAGLRGPAGAGGVVSFNGRSGVVSLHGADVTTALGYTPVDSDRLSAVAFSGDYSDLASTPLIPTTPDAIGAATEAQGALADSAVQPAELYAQLAVKVDKVAGYGLSQENFTAAEKAKLAGLEGSHFKGLFVSLAALELAIPAGASGDYADVDEGGGTDTLRYLWDVDDARWIPAGSGAPLTAAQVKTLYESNADTNAFTDAEKAKLDGAPSAADFLALQQAYVALEARVAALEAGGAAPNGALVDDNGALLIDGAGNNLILGE